MFRCFSVVPSRFGDENVKGRPCGSVAQLAECSSKSACFVVSPLFREDSGVKMSKDDHVAR